MSSLLVLVAFGFAMYYLADFSKKFKAEDNAKREKLAKEKGINEVPSKKVIVKKELTEEEKQKLKEEKERKDKERKNTGLLITGALLIVLAAIIFLTSDWQRIPAIGKTAILALFTFLFLGLSKISDTKLHLKKASLTFYYIAMAYIPVCLISFSVFGLFGDYFSIYGDGNYIYLSVAMCITSIIYYINYKVKELDTMLFGSILAQVSTVVLFALIFETSFEIMLLTVVLYNIILSLVNKKMGTKKEISFINVSLSCITSVLSIGLLDNVSLFAVAVYALLAVSHFINARFDLNKELSVYCFQGFLQATGYYTIINFLDALSPDLYLGLMILYTACVYMIESVVFKNEDKIYKNSSLIAALIANLICYAYTKTAIDLVIIKSFFVLLVEEVYLVLAYSKAEAGDVKSLLKLAIPACYIGIYLDILSIFQSVDYQIIIAFSLISYVVNELVIYNVEKELYKGFAIVINAFNALLYIFYLMVEPVFKTEFWWMIGLTCEYAFSFIRNKDQRIFKYLTYAGTCLSLISFSYFIDASSDIRYILFTLVSLAAIYFENYTSIKDDLSPMFLTVFELLAIAALWSMEIAMFKVVLLFIYAGILYYVNITQKQEDGYRLVPALALLAIINTPGLIKEVEILISIILSILLTVIACSRRKVTIDTFISFFLVLNALVKIDETYFRYILIIMWAVINAFYAKTEKSKDGFKAIAYFFGYMLYSTVLTELVHVEYKAFNLIGVIILEVLLLKDTLPSFIKERDLIEYLVLGITYLCAIGMYVNEADGLIFVGFIIGLVVLAYYKKYGNIVICSLASIVVNFIVLTRTFWASLGLAVYVLLVGLLFVGIVMYNQKKDEAKEIFNNIKEKLDK